MACYIKFPKLCNISRNNHLMSVVSLKQLTIQNSYVVNSSLYEVTKVCLCFYYSALLRYRALYLYEFELNAYLYIYIYI